MLRSQLRKLSPFVGFLALLVLLLGAAVPRPEALPGEAAHDSSVQMAQDAPSHEEHATDTDAMVNSRCSLDARCVSTVVIATIDALISPETAGTQQGPGPPIRLALSRPGVELPPPRS